MRVIENLKNMIHEANEHTLPKCRETMQDNLSQVLRRRKPVILFYTALFQMNAMPKCISLIMLVEVVREFLSET